ncbi:hypothetical protein DPMN_192181 [Dreissena polymorpha]|uniref:Uncharacterized protein n=1 Tax=Dreissena polymorpha TaxID=45954 RepID=A0A9D3XXI5_DREPO|nr:hypothetical protein DPMN_192181 [Dreissena polymorpha]
MASNFSSDDIVQLSKLIVQQIKPDLLNDISTKVQNLIDIEVKRQTAHLNDEKAKLKMENDQLRKDHGTQHLEIDEREQYGRRMCLNITNIPGDTGDPQTDRVEEKVLQIAATNVIKLIKAVIDRCHRVGRKKDGKQRKVIVKFTNSSARPRLYEARRNLKDGVFIQENATKFREELAYEARQLVRNKLLTKSWVAGCKVYGLLPDHSGNGEKRILIRDRATVISIRDGKPLAEHMK